MTSAFTSKARGTPETLQLGLIGEGIQPSRTPAMQEAEGAAHGLRTVYRLFDTLEMDPAPALGDLVQALQLCGYAGFNVTFPYKIAICDHLDGLSAEAEAIGAVNTVSLRDGRRFGHNTDFGGFSDSFARDMAGAHRDRVLQIGAGGAGLAAAFALLENDVESLFIYDIDSQRAEHLVSVVAARHGKDRVRLATGIEGNFDGIVNATPIGTEKFPGLPYPTERLSAEMFVIDVNYFPLETDLVLKARERGCRAIGGAGMAVGQAIRSFACFTGLEADADRMTARFLALG